MEGGRRKAEGGRRKAEGGRPKQVGTGGTGSTGGTGGTGGTRTGMPLQKTRRLAVTGQQCVCGTRRRAGQLKQKPAGRRSPSSRNHAQQRRCTSIADIPATPMNQQRRYTSNADEPATPIYQRRRWTSDADGPATPMDQRRRWTSDADGPATPTQQQRRYTGNADTPAQPPAQPLYQPSRYQHSPHPLHASIANSPVPPFQVTPRGAPALTTRLPSLPATPAQSCAAFFSTGAESGRPHRWRR